nr:MAG TPA: hypothetical protein [Caudoviricetes sp.]
MEKVKSSKSAVLLNVGTAASPDYKRIGKGVTSLPISYNPKTTTETYVDEDNATNSVDSYEISSDIEQTAIKDDPIFDYVDGIRRGLKTGSDCETTAVLVDIYNMNITDGSGTGKGQKFNATVTVSDFDLSGGETAKIKYKIGFNGDPTEVAVNIANGVITVGTTGKS